MLPVVDSVASPVLRGILNGGIFVAALFLLERSADQFVDSTDVVAKQLGVPPILVGLLTAGAEWEELAVVVASLVQGRPALALSNIYGSSIANILGSFSIGLLFSPRPLAGQELVSARIYVSLGLALAVVVAFIGAGIGPLWRLMSPDAVDQDGASRWVIGGGLVGVFVVYVAGIVYGIYRGVMTPPEGSDSDTSDSSSDDDTSVDHEPQQLIEDDLSSEGGETPEWRAARESRDGLPPSRTAYLPWLSRKRRSSSMQPSERTPIFSRLFRQPSYGQPGQARIPPSAEQAIRARQRRRLWSRVALLVWSSLALSLAGYLLSSTTASLAELWGLADSSLGLTLLSSATTLPEKLVAFKSGSRQQTGVLVANTVGSNVFLGSLVLGIVWLAQGRVELGDGGPDGDDIARAGGVDALVLLGSSLVLTLVVWFGAFKRWIGVAMLVSYVAYVVSVFVRE